MPDEPTLRSPAEVLRAHDILTHILTSPEMTEAIFGSESSRKMAHVAADVLCWTLMHTHNEHFAANLAWVEAVLRLHGYELMDSGRLNRRTQ